MRIIPIWRGREMELAPDEMRQRMDRAKELLRRSGIKPTHQRMDIFCEVARTGDHPDAVTVYERVRERLPTLSLDTVYRTLWLLKDLGLITTLGTRRERVRFDANTRPHHHFVCTQCGMAYDIDSQELGRLDIPDSVKALGEVDRICVEFRGRCARCLNKGSDAVEQ